MSLIKLAIAPIIVVNKQSDPNAGSSKTFSPKNVGAAVVGGTTGFAANEAIKRLKGFDKTKVLHNYGARMGSVLGGFAGAAGLYSMISKKKKEQQPNFYML